MASNNSVAFASDTTMDVATLLNFFANRKDLPNGIHDWRLLLSEQDIMIGVNHMAKQIEAKFAGKEITLLCVLKGGAPIFGDLIKKITIPYKIQFLPLSFYRNAQKAGSSADVMTGGLSSNDFNGRHVIIVDELLDTGRTLKEAEHIIKGIAPNVASVSFATLLVKNKEHEYVPEGLISAYNFPDVWGVGYGLDNGGYLVGWPCIFGTPKSDPSLATADDAMFNSTEEYAAARRQISEQVKKLIK